MSHKKTLVGLCIELFTIIHVDRIENMVNCFETHRCALEFDSLFLGNGTGTYLIAKKRGAPQEKNTAS